MAHRAVAVAPRTGSAYRPLPVLRPSPRLVTPVGRIADALTLASVFLLPNAGLAVGGVLGIGYGDILLGFAFIARAFHVLIGGIPMVRLRRWSFLLGITGAICGAGLISGIINGNPVTSLYIFLVIALLGTTLIVGTFGQDDHERNVRLIGTALALGCCLLALSSFYQPAVRGRTIGYAVHPNALGHSLIMGIAVIVWLIDRSTTFRQRVVWAGALVLCLAGLMNSGSRGGTLAVFVFGSLYLLLRGNLRVVLLTLAALWLAGLALLLGAVELGVGNPLERLFVGNTTSQFADLDRQEKLEENFEDIREDPIFGKGWDTISEIHVVYFQGWIGGGAVPAVLFMLLGVTMATMALWQPKRELALACGAAGIAVAWLFTNIITARDQWVFIALVFAQSPSPLVLGPQIRAALR